MAFSVKDYYANGFDVANDAASIREAAQALLDANWFPGNSAPKGWAEKALQQLDRYDQIASGDGNRYDNHGTDQLEKALADAYRWISGAAQPTAAKRVVEQYNRNKKETLDKLRNEYANIANLTDFSNPNISAEERQKLQARADQYLRDLEPYLKDAENFGIDTAEYGVTRTESGFVPTGELAQWATGPTSNAGKVSPDGGNTYEGTKIVKESDGTFSVVGETSGKKYATGATSESDALSKQNQVQVGAAPQPIGYFDTQNQGGSGTGAGAGGGTGTGGGSGAGGGTSTSGILPPGIDTTGFTPDQIQALEQAYTTAQNDPRIIASQSLTDQDIANFLETAKSEFSPYYQQLFTRASEDFVRGLEYKAQERELQLKREKEALDQGLRDTADASGDAGLASSGIRAKAEARLKSEAADTAASSRRQFNYDVTSLGRTAEDLLGSGNLPANQIPDVNGNPVFQASGNVRGSLEREQTTAEQTRASELEKDERLRRVGLVDPTAALEAM